jgi:integrase
VLRASTRRTLNQHLDEWLAGLDVSSRTRVDYENITRRYWRPTLGNLRLDKITTDDIVRVMAEMKARGLSPRTRQQARTILGIALAAAVDGEHLAVNPASGSRRLRVPQVRRPPSTLQASEVNALLDGTKDDPMHALWQVLLDIGLRLGEALGLKWSDVDLDGRRMQVVHALVRPTHGREWLLESPKTGRTRQVRLLNGTVAALTAHRDRQAVERLVAGESYAGHDFVFADERGEPLQGTVIYKYHWRPMLKRLGLPAVRLHDCRHSAATLQLEAGVDMKIVQENLGHASITITSDIYSHVMDRLRREAADKYEAHRDATRTNQGQPEISEP